MTILPPAALDQHVAILGKTGSGKTWAAKCIVERLLDQERQVCVIDPTSAWWGLRLDHRGRPGGYNVILLGGEHADIPISRQSGEAVARLVTEQRANVVVDTGNMTVSDCTAWFIGFAGTLYRTIRQPLHLVIDEAHHFMPQGKVPDPQAGKMLHAGNRLMSGGRSRGIRGMLITQRPAKLHKDSLTCADTLVAMRCLSPQDRKAYKDWIDGCGDAELGRELVGSLASLQRGDGWVWYPEGEHLKRIKFPRIKTYDSSAAPRHGGKAPPAVSEIDLTAVKAAMSDAVAEAAANDPKALRRRVAELERDLAERNGHGVDEAEVRREVEAALSKAHAWWADQWRGAFTSSLDLVRRRANEFRDSASEFAEQLEQRAIREPPDGYPGDIWAPPLKAAPYRQGTGPAAEHVARTAAKCDIIRGGGARRMLEIMVSRHPAGFTEAQWATLSRLKRTGGTWQTYKSRLATAGLVTREGSLWRATEAALVEYAHLRSAAPTDVLADWKQKLGRGPARMIDALMDAGPMTRAELADAVELTAGAGTFGTYLSRLRSNGLVESDGDRIQLSEAVN